MCSGCRMGCGSFISTWLLRGQVREVGGLEVISLGLVQSIRNVQQLLGRSGRQGDPGETWQLLEMTDPSFVAPEMQEINEKILSFCDCMPLLFAHPLLS